MFHTTDVRDTSFLLTLEELGQLATAGTRPAETLMNVVALIANRFDADVCSAYLLEPDRANLVLAATIGLQPTCIGTLRLALHEGLVGLVAEQVRPVAVEQVRAHPRFKYFREAGEETFQSFLGVPLIERGVLQGTLVVQTIETRIFSEEEIEALTAAAAQVAPIISEARSLDQFIAPSQEKLWALARNLWWSWDDDSASLFREVAIPPAGGSSITIRFRSCRRYRSPRSSSAPASWRCTAGSTTPIAASASTLRPTARGAPRTPACCGRGRSAYFSAEFGLHESFPIYSGGLGVLAGDHIKSASDLDIPLVGVGLFYGQGYFRQRLDISGWQQEEYLETDTSQLPMEPAIGRSGEPVTVQIETRGGGHHGQGVARPRRPLRSAAARLERRRQLARGSRADVAAVRRRRTRAHPPGAAARRRRLPRAAGDGHHAGRSAPQRRTQRIRGARSDSQPDGGGRPRLRRRPVPRVSREVVFTTHTPVPAGHDRFTAT